jgi:hypothetical protein
VAFEVSQQRRHHGLDGVFAGGGQQVLAVHRRLHVQAAQRQQQVLLDVFGVALFQHQHRCLAGAEGAQLGRHQRVGDVEHVQRDAAVAEGIGQAHALQRADQRRVQAALHDDAQLLQVAVEGLVEPVLGDVALRGRDALLDLELLVAEGHRRVRQPHVVEAGRLGDQRARGQSAAPRCRAR